MKKIFKVFMALVLLLSTTNIQVLASNSFDESDSLSLSSVDSILEEYHYKILNASQTEIMTKNSVTSEKDDLIIEREQALVDAGYDVYTANKDNMKDIGKSLNTDLSVLGFDQDEELLIVVSGESSGMTRGSAGSSFDYTYNGNTYTMRYFTVTAMDPEAHSSWSQADNDDLLVSNAQQLIAATLNGGISLYLDAFYAGLGTVSSICGLDISDFLFTSDSTLVLHGGTSWTRVYTQYYSNYDQSWLYGSAVEKAYSTTHIDGLYLSSETSAFEPIPDDTVKKTIYSDEYFDYTWRKQQAAIAAYYGSGIRLDSTGTIKYYYDGNMKFKHYAPAVY